MCYTCNMKRIESKDRRGKEKMKMLRIRNYPDIIHIDWLGKKRFTLFSIPKFWQ